MYIKHLSYGPIVYRLNAQLSSVASDIIPTRKSHTNKKLNARLPLT